MRIWNSRRGATSARLILSVLLAVLCVMTQAALSLPLNAGGVSLRQTGAQVVVGDMRHFIFGLPSSETNARQAAEWYRKVAEQGYAEAQFKMGIMYYNGRGVPEDRRQAFAWFSLAAAQGYKNAKEAQTIVAKELDQDALEQAKNLAVKYYKAYVVPFR